VAFALGKAARVLRLFIPICNRTAALTPICRDRARTACFWVFAEVFRLRTSWPTAPVEFVFSLFGNALGFLVGWDKVAGAPRWSVIQC
jgi:hypothetical protein